MRRQSFRDLIEYYDYNMTILAHSKRLSPHIISGNHRVSPALLLELNKGDKLSRTIQIPAPDDALVFQVLTEGIVDAVLSKAPTKHAYFARSHSTLKDIHTMDAPSLYPWFKIWPKYQTEILDFTKANKYLVVTDILSYFDSVPHYALDRALTRLNVSQWQRDLILFMLEGFVQRPAYAPLTLRSIPQLDLDAPRLLSHVLLYPIDQYLERATAGSFARWMDDINFGVDTKTSAKELLRNLERMLARIELRLNARKTEILSRRDAEEYLHAKTNLELTAYKKLVGTKVEVSTIEHIYEDFIHFAEKESRTGRWDQVYRRYVNLIETTWKKHPDNASLKDLRAAIVDRLLVDFLNLSDYRTRQTIIRAWHEQSPSRKALSFIVEQMYDIGKNDDVIALDLASLLVSYQLTSAQQRNVLEDLTFDVIRPGEFFGTALVLCKYGKAETIYDFIVQTAPLWSVNEFLSRQIVAVWSIMSPGGRESEEAKRLMLEKVQRGPADLVRYFESLRSVTVMPAGLEGYVSPAKMTRPYTLAKTIVCSNLLRSLELPGQVRERISKALEAIADKRLRSLALNIAHP
jgi:hypothetical protein